MILFMRPEHMSPEFQTMAVHYYCHMSPSVSLAIGGSSDHVIGTYIYHMYVLV